MKRVVVLLALLVVAMAGLVGCQTTPAGDMQAAAVLPGRPAVPPPLPVADQVCSDGTPVVSLGDCPSASQQRRNEQQRTSQAILGLHAHGG